MQGQEQMTQAEPEHGSSAQLPGNGSSSGSASSHATGTAAASSTLAATSSSASPIAIDTSLLDRWAHDADATAARLSAAIAEQQREEATYFDDMRADEYAYVLRAVLVHDGRSAGQGHYWVRVRSSLPLSFLTHPANTHSRNSLYFDPLCSCTGLHS